MTVAERRAPAHVHWVVDTATCSLRLNLVREAELDMTSAWSSALTAAVNRDVTTILATFDLSGQLAVKNHVDFAVRLNQLRRALKVVGGPTVWNLHASSGNRQNDDVWNARGLMVFCNEVRKILQCYSTVLQKNIMKMQLSDKRKCLK